MTARERLAAALRDEGGLLAGALPDDVPHAPEPLLGGAATEQHALVLAAVREGYLLHYGEPRLVRTADPDLALLGGDRLYALGLERLAALGDLGAVARLAELISRCAEAHAERRPEGAEAAWRAAATDFGTAR